MRYAIVDDDQTFIEYFCSVSKVYLKDCTLDCFNTPLSFLEAFTKQAYDVLFLDIDMPQVDGITLANKLNEQYEKECIVVFVTNKKELVYDAYGLNVLSFIYKPQLETKISDVFEKIYNFQEIHKGILIDVPAGKIKLKVHEIQKIEKIGRKIYMFLQNGETILTKYTTLSQIEDMIQNTNFMYVNRSVIANLSYAKSVRKGYLYYSDDEKVEISRGRFNDVKNKFIFVKYKV